MSTPTYSELFLGPVIITGFEIPDSLPLGGEQQMIVTKFIGRNKRQVQVLGSQPRDMGWRGTFLYDSAIARARALDALRINGEPLDLVWGDFHYTVIIDRFHFDPSNIFHIPYEISLQVVQDLTAPGAINVPSRDTIEQGIIGVIIKIQDATAALARIVAFVNAARQGDVRGLISTASGLVSAIGTVSGFVGSQDLTTLRGFANQATVVAQQAIGLYDFAKAAWQGGVLSRLDQTGAGVNEVFALGNAAQLLASLILRFSSPPYQVNVPVVRDNLFSISTRYYGKLDSWDQIADFNNLRDSQLLGPQTVKLPVINGVPPTQAAPPNTVYETTAPLVPAAERGR